MVDKAPRLGAYSRRGEAYVQEKLREEILEEAELLDRTWGIGEEVRNRYGDQVHLQSAVNEIIRCIVSRMEALVDEVRKLKKEGE